PMPTLSHAEHLYTLALGADETRFSPEWLDSVHAALDELEATSGPAALITTGAGKFYSNGLDLDWLGENADQLDAYVGRVESLFARVLTLPVPTVADVHGHAFGAVAMVTVATD